MGSTPLLRQYRRTLTGGSLLSWFQVVRFRNDADHAECAQTFPSLIELTYSIRYASPHCPSLILVRTGDRHLGDKGMSTGWDFEKYVHVWNEASFWVRPCVRCSMLLDLMVVLVDTYPDHLGSDHGSNSRFGLLLVACLHTCSSLSCVRNIGFFEGDRCCVFDFSLTLSCAVETWCLD
jgi:hypothetical protein